MSLTDFPAEQFPYLPQGQLACLSDGMEIHYQRFTPEGVVRHTVVLIHGSGPGASGWSNFCHNVDSLVEQGFEVILPDLPGYGFTSKPTDKIYHLDYFVGYLAELMDVLDIEKAALVGNSLGGAIAVGFALAHPQRVTHLALMGTGGVEEREVYFATEGIQAMVKYPMGSPEFTKEVLAKLLTVLVYDDSLVTPELVEQRYNILQIQNPQVLATMQVPNMTERLGDIECPVLGFWGSDDKFCPISGAETLVKGCRDAKLITLSRCGHWVMVEYPELFNRELADFLSSSGANQ